MGDALIELDGNVMPSQVTTQGFDQRLGIIGVKVFIEQAVIVAQIEKMKTLHELGRAQLVRWSKERPRESMKNEAEGRGETSAIGELVETDAVEGAEGFLFVVFDEVAHAPARRVKQHVAHPVKSVSAQRNDIEHWRS